MSMVFDPEMLPSPGTLNRLRDLSVRGRQTQPIVRAEWYTPILLVGKPGVPLEVGRLGMIPIIWDCEAIGWTLSSNVAGSLILRLTYATFAANPTYATLSSANAPVLAGTRRSRYREVPHITGWSPRFLEREAEIEVFADGVGSVEQIELVLYLRKIR